MAQSLEIFTKTQIYPEEKMMESHENKEPKMIQFSAEINELVAAISLAQAEIKDALKDSTNPMFKSKYADLSAVWNACREALTKNKLAITQPVYSMNDDYYMCTLLAHASGQFLRTDVKLKAVGNRGTNEIQALGSAITYMRRYEMGAVLGIVTEVDDDGNATGQAEQKKPGARQGLSLAQMVQKKAVGFFGEQGVEQFNQWRAEKGLAGGKLSEIKDIDLAKIMTALNAEIKALEAANAND